MGDATDAAMNQNLLRLPVALLARDLRDKAKLDTQSEDVPRHCKMVVVSRISTERACPHKLHV